MRKKKRGKEKFEHQNHPVFKMHSRRTFGQKSADRLTKVAGSWFFIISLFVFLAIWMGINGFFLIQYERGNPFDPYPFILLNLVLSCLAAIQAPIILMSQNRQTQRDRVKTEYDFKINKKAEEEIRDIKRLLLSYKKKK